MTLTAVDYLMQALQAIAEAHAKGVVHRDLKPSNLFLTRRADGTPLVKVLDFGIAKAVSETSDGSHLSDTLTGASGFLGSPSYMSPEQIRNARQVDARSDVWAIGVILHELLTARFPFEAGTTTELLAAVLTEAPVRLRQAPRSQESFAPDGISLRRLLESRRMLDAGRTAKNAISSHL